MAIAPLTPPPPRGAEIAQGDKTPTNIQFYGWFIKLQKIINQLIAASGGGGVTQIVAGSGISIAPPGGTGVVTVINAGVNNITSADGSVIITNPSGPAANLSVPAGLAFDITPDTHPAFPAGIGLGPNDEFEFGATIDTAGSRYPGATAWTAFNILTATNTVNKGSLALAPAFLNTISINGYTQPLVASPWSYTAKIATYQSTTNSLFGIILATSSGSTGNIYFFNLNQLTLEVQTFSNATTFIATVASQTFATTTFLQSGSAISTTYPIYLRITLTGGNYIFAYSNLGVEGSYTTLLTVSTAAFMPTPALIGLAGSNRSIATQGVLVSDWFRRTA